jgi:ATP-dependent Clp protease ATP-binding subunit ClpC
VFERFTERARQVVVFAQDEARMLRHNYIGTEHLLLGLLREEEGLAARVLDSLDVSLEEVRAQVARIVGQGDEVATGQIPFTPRAKKVLELSLREALELGHNYIGTEHVLLGLIRENEGVAARILLDFGADDELIRGQLMRMLAGSTRDTTGARVGGFAAMPTPVEPWERSSFSFGRMPRRVTSYEPSASGSLLLGWLLFAVALAIGIGLGWLIWG